MIPSHIKRIMEKLQAGQELTPADQKALEAWGESMSKAGEKALPKAKGEKGDMKNAGIEENPGFLFADHRQFPDLVELQPVPGSVTYRYDINAKKTDRNPSRKEEATTTVNATMEVTSSRSKKGVILLTSRGTGKVVYTFKSPENTFTETTSLALSYTGKPVPEFAPVANNWLYGSKEKGVARFVVWDGFNLVGVMTYKVKEVSTTKGKTTQRSYSGKKWFLPQNLDELAQFISHPGFGDEGEPAPMDVESLPFWIGPIRVPCYSVGGTPFATAVRKMEESGKPLGGGLVEGSFDGKRSTGSFQVKLADGETLPVFLTNRPQEDLKWAWPGTLTVSWRLGEQPEAELVLEPEEPDVYDRWLPLPAGKPAYGEAPPLRLRARFRPPKDSPSQDRVYGQIDFYLQDVTRHKGECTNYPVEGKAKDDLRFAEQSKQPWGIVVVSPTHAHTKDKKFNEAVAIVEATDTGAFGKLTAVCEEMGLKATYEPTGEAFLTVPRDENGNRIADRWEKDKGIFDGKFAATWDEDDQPSGQKRRGDGYTLFEEYRGFMTFSGFVRTDPTQKDIFVYDPDGLCAKYYEPYNPAKLTLHYIDPTMMKFGGVARDPNNRWVNTNSNEDQFYARQYALFVKEWVAGRGDAGVAKSTDQDDPLFGKPAKKGPPSAVPYADWGQGLKDCYIVRINPLAVKMSVEKITDPSLREYQYNMAFESTVIHEIGHALGIHHHAPPGKEETDDSVWQGAKDCAMRLTSTAEYKNTRLIVPQTRYCTQQCFGQINIKMDP